ncbi:hypothetical protein AB0420_36325, partial [Streptomyces caelestis]|uniref:hypothetical protein n=1 Tax=Streptomyces caelestis TaxID=36816 RepID=UPI00344F58D1
EFVRNQPLRQTNTHGTASCRINLTPRETSSKTRVGYEIPFTRHFYVYEPPRPLAEIDAELKSLEAEIQGLLKEVTK